MKSFARRSSKSKNTDGTTDTPDLLDLDALDLAPISASDQPTTGSVPPAVASVVDPATAENDEFVERLGDLDRFIGGGALGATPTSWSAPAMTRNLPAAPTPAVAPISHPRPPAPERAAAPAPIPVPVEAEDEAQEFLDRLGDLDRFIGGAPAAPAPAETSSAPPAPPAPAAPAAVPATVDTEDEAQEFLDRLGDLDRFIGGNNAGGTNPPER